MFIMTSDVSVMAWWIVAFSECDLRVLMVDKSTLRVFGFFFRVILRLLPISLRRARS